MVLDEEAEPADNTHKELTESSRIIELQNSAGENSTSLQRISA